MTEEAGMEQTKELEDLTDEELRALHGTLLLDSRHDGEARERLETVEAERARRIVAADRSEREGAERRSRTIRTMTDAELERRRTELGGLDPSENRAELSLIATELRRREESRQKDAEALIRPAEEKVKAAATDCKETLAELVARTRVLADAIGARSAARSAAFGGLPTAFAELERVRERFAAVLALAIRPTALGEPGWDRYRRAPLTELL